VLFVVRNRTMAGYQVIDGWPKTRAGVRAVALDRHTVSVLREHRRRQTDHHAKRLAADRAWRDSGCVFVRPDGQPIHPGYVTQRFAKLVKAANVPPIRLHDLRRGAASLAHQAGTDLRTLQDQFGHSSIVVTADTYTSVLLPVQRRSAEATAQLVLAAAHRTRRSKNHGRRNRPTPRRTTGAPTPAGPAAATKPPVTAEPRETTARQGQDTTATPT
jgi:integrase